MFCITNSNHRSLSSMADKKAELMIAVNTILLTAVVSLLLNRLEEQPLLIIPTCMLIASCLSCMVIAILVTRPNLSSGRFLPKDIGHKGVNLLFFGNYFKMSLEEYTEGMQRLMQEKNLMYQTLLMDGYGQSKVLGRKYRLLRIAYSTFVFGLIASIAAFIIVWLW